MEQQKTIQKTVQAEEQKHSEAARSQKSPGSSWVAQALLAGAPVWDLPQQSLTELAERVGNSGMLALAAMRSPEAELHQTSLAGSEPQTPAAEVPDMACRLMPAADLTAGAWPSSACDPAALA